MDVSTGGTTLYRYKHCHEHILTWVMLHDLRYGLQQQVVSRQGTPISCTCCSSSHQQHLDWRNINDHRTVCIIVYSNNSLTLRPAAACGRKPAQRLAPSSRVGACRRLVASSANGDNTSTCPPTSSTSTLVHLTHAL
jgi:hypothetical protein